MVTVRGRWIKLFVGIIWEADIRELTAAQRWVFVTILTLGAKEEGFLRGKTASIEHLAVASATDVRTCRKSLPILSQLCLINVLENGDIEIPNWSYYQSSTTRRDQYRDDESERNAHIDKTRLDKTRQEENIYQEVFDFWTSFEGLPGRKITEETKSGINARIKDGYTVKEIKTAIENYVKSTEEWVVKHRKQKGWTLGQFLSRFDGKNLERFKEPLMAEGETPNGFGVERPDKEMTDEEKAEIAEIVRKRYGG